MAEHIVINTGPLITLARAELLEPMSKLPFEFICPEEVRSEIEAGVAAGYQAAQPDWVTSMPLSSSLDPVALAALDQGEAAVIQLALEQNINRVCIDERKGRRAALAVGLKVTGTLGLLARAKALGILPALRPEIDKLTKAGAFYDPDLIAKVLQGVGE